MHSRSPTFLLLALGAATTACATPDTDTPTHEAPAAAEAQPAGKPMTSDLSRAVPMPAGGGGQAPQPAQPIPSVPEPQRASSLPAGVTVVDAGDPADPMGVSTYRLSNGFTVMLSVNRESPRIETWITVRAGSAKDPADATGMAHYLEHMQFKGSPRLGTRDWEKEKVHLDRITALYEELFSATDEAKRKDLYARIDAENQEASKYAIANEFDRLYDGLGVQGVNAFTNNDQTSYTVNIPANRIEQWAIVETERLRAPVYRLFQSELEAVYEEKNQSLDNRGRVMFETTMRAAFPKHAYGTQPTIGHVEHLKNPSLRKMYRYFETWYQPSNMVIAMSGDLDKEATLAILERHLGALPSKAVPADPVFETPKPEGVVRVEAKFPGEEEVQILWVTVPETHPDQPALVMCDMMITNGHTGLIDVNLNQKQLVRRAGSNPIFLEDGGLQTASGSPKPGQTLEEVEALLLAEVEKLKKGEFSESDMRAVLTDFEIQRKRELESNRNRVQAMTGAFINARPWREERLQIERLRKVTKDDVVAAARKYLDGNRVVAVRRNAPADLPKIQKPGFTPVKIDDTRRSAFFEDVISRPAAPVEPKFIVKGRDVTETAVRTGTLIYVRNPMNDVFDLQISIPWGTDHDPRLSTAFGLAELGGAGAMDGPALKQKLYAIGSSFSAAASREETVVTVSGIETHLEETFDLLRMHFDAPHGVGQADLDKLVQRTVAQRRDMKQTPQGLAAALGEYARRGADSAFLTAPKNEEMAAWKAEDLLAAARAVWNYGGRTITYTGQADPARVAALVDIAPASGVAAPPARKPVKTVPVAANRVLFLDKKAAQCQVASFAADGAYDRAAVPVQRVYNEIMSGSMSGIVFQEIRESRSLAYSAAAFYRQPGWREDEQMMNAQLSTQADKTIEALDVMFQLVRNFEAKGTQTRFENAVRSIDQAYRTTRVEFRQLAGTVSGWARLGLSEDPRPWNWEQVKKMTLADVVAWSKRFEKMPFTTVIVGPKDKFDAAKLAQFGEVVEMKPDQLFNW
ncbi:MAG: hypothetical protein HMLKMBBP_03108 [Planctomycetes bacterium]|nr:hypothetical protein [Planctomycetota bacterium]